MTKPELSNPEWGRRAGIKVIGCHYTSDDYFGTFEIITNAYGNGFVNQKPSGPITDSQWADLVSQAQRMEKAASGSH